MKNGEFAAELGGIRRGVGALPTARARCRRPASSAQLKAIVDDAMPGKHVDIDDNLFDVGASSLTLIQIHEKIDELYPGVVDLTELFDFPTDRRSWRSTSRRSWRRRSRQPSRSPPRPCRHRQRSAAAASTAGATTTSRADRA